MGPGLAKVLPALLPLLIVALVVRRNLRARRLKLERLWLLPAVLVAAILWIMAAEPAPGPLILVGLAIVAALGAMVGWWRGRLTHVHLHPETHELTSRASLAGTMLILAVFAARYGLRMWAIQAQGGPGAHAPAEAIYVTDAFMLFAAGLVCAQRLEMFLRCRRLLADAQAVSNRID